MRKKKTHLFLINEKSFSKTGDCSRERASPSRRGALWRRGNRRRRGQRRRGGGAAAQGRCCRSRRWALSSEAAAALDLGAQGRGGGCCRRRPLLLRSCRCLCRCCRQLHPRLRSGEHRGAPPTAPRGASCNDDGGGAGTASCSSSADGERRARPELFHFGALPLQLAEAGLKKSFSYAFGFFVSDFCSLLVLPACDV